MFSLLSDEGRRVLWKWAHLPQRGRQCMKHWIQSISICDSSHFLSLFSVFKFQFEISSVLSFISFRDEVIYTSSWDSSWSDVAFRYLFTSRRASPALLKASAVTHLSPHFDEIKAKGFFYPQPPKQPPPLFNSMSADTFDFVEHKKQGGSFTLLTS